MAKKKATVTVVEVHQMSVHEIFDHTASLSPKTAKLGREYVFLPGSTRMPILVAHADTVHKQLPQMISFDRKMNALSSPTGLGADDRAGVYAIWYLWDLLDVKPALLICDHEESGGTGAWEAGIELYDELRDYPYMLEIDRKGRAEAVFYNYEDDKFINYIESFGFKEEWGIYSDVATLGEELNMCSVNLSAGYYMNHTVQETLVLHHLDYTIKHAKKIILDTYYQRRQFKLPKPPDRLRGGWSVGRGGWDRWDYGNAGGSCSTFADEPLATDEFMDRNMRSLYQKEYEICEGCGRRAPLNFVDSAYGFVCNVCEDHYNKLEEMEKADDGFFKEEKSC